MEPAEKADLVSKIELMLNSGQNDFWKLCESYNLSPAKVESLLDDEDPPEFIDDALAFLTEYADQLGNYLDHQSRTDMNLVWQNEYDKWWDKPVQPRKFFKGIYN